MRKTPTPGVLNRHETQGSWHPTLYTHSSESPVNYSLYSSAGTPYMHQVQLDGARNSLGLYDFDSSAYHDQRIAPLGRQDTEDGSLHWSPQFQQQYDPGSQAQTTPWTEHDGFPAFDGSFHAYHHGTGSLDPSGFSNYR